MVNTDMAEDQEAETAAVSPESGISSASPLSWQVEDNIGGEDRSSSSPVLLQPGSYPRKNKKKVGHFKNIFPHVGGISTGYYFNVVICSLVRNFLPLGRGAIFVQAAFGLKI